MITRKSARSHDLTIYAINVPNTIGSSVGVATPKFELIFF